MNYIDKLFAQYPFIYKIGGKYYAFGNRVCAECKNNIPSLELRYNRYCKAFEQKVSQEAAKEIFLKLKFAAEFIDDQEDEDEDPKEKIKKFGFDAAELEELENQVGKYIEFWQKYRLQDFHWS